MPTSEILPHQFVCPVMAQKLVVPCKLRECPYNVRNKAEGNCVLYYMHTRSLDTLLCVEVAFLYNTSYRTVETIRQSAVRKIGQALIGHQIKNTMMPRMYYITGSPICCVCEKFTDDPIRVPLVSLVWCSRECQVAKPPRLIQLECEYHTAIGNIIKIATFLFRTVTNIEDILRVSRDDLYQACQQYLGKVPSEIFSGIKSKSQPSSRDFIQRQESSDWLDEVTAPISQIIERYSSFAWNTKPLYARIDNIFYRALA